MYFYLGNCLNESECTKGVIENDIKKCKCMEDDKCLYCSSESIQNDIILCEICNEGYYQKRNDNINKYPYFNCYNNETIGDGYYLNNTIYEPCYLSCKNCYGIGDENDNKCIECNINYTFIENNTNGNCYPICEYYYYFDNNSVYQCTSDENCPEGYKLIYNKRKCINNCINDNFYKYEYKNVCYEICSNNTIKTSLNIYLCELIFYK